MADFQSKISEFEQRGVTVVGASVDSLENAKKTIEREKLTYPLAYGLEAREFSAKTGAFFDEQKGFLHATGFVLNQNGKVAQAVYSTGPVGRFVAADCLGLVDYLNKQKVS